MNIAELGKFLRTSVIGNQISFFSEVTSTNDLAAESGKASHAEGLVIFAEEQTAGRGRLGRHWQGMAGQSLTFSILLRPTWPDVSRLSLAVAVAMARAFEPLGSEAIGIKWPNDIFIKGRKVAGILCEATSDYVVVGIGVNVLQKPTEFSAHLAERAGSLAMFTHEKLYRPQIAANILNEFDSIYRSLPGGFAKIMMEYERRNILLGQTISVEIGTGRISGFVSGTDESGALKIRDDAGRETLVMAGEVSALAL